MRFGTTYWFTAVLSTVLISTFAHARCPVDEVVVKGRVDHAPLKAKVRVQLMYEKGLSGELGEATIEEGSSSWRFSS